MLEQSCRTVTLSHASFSQSTCRRHRFLHPALIAAMLAYQACDCALFVQCLCLIAVCTMVCLQPMCTLSWPHMLHADCLHHHAAGLQLSQMGLSMLWSARRSRHNNERKLRHKQCKQGHKHAQCVTPPSHKTSNKSQAISM